MSDTHDLQQKVHTLLKGCTCDDPDPTIAADNWPHYWVECGGCGRTTEPQRGPLVGEVLLRTVRRWNKQTAQYVETR